MCYNLYVWCVQVKINVEIKKYTVQIKLTQSLWHIKVVTQIYLHDNPHFLCTCSLQYRAVDNFFSLGVLF